MFIEPMKAKPVKMQVLPFIRLPEKHKTEQSPARICSHIKAIYSPKTHRYLTPSVYSILHSPVSPNMLQKKNSALCILNKLKPLVIDHNLELVGRHVSSTLKLKPQQKASFEGLGFSQQTCLQVKSKYLIETKQTKEPKRVTKSESHKLIPIKVLRQLKQVKKSLKLPVDNDKRRSALAGWDIE